MKNLPKYLFAVVVLLLISNNSFAEPTVSQVDGNCFLGKDVDTHEGTTVVFLAISPLAVSDSCVTDSSGHFFISLADGQYSVHYSQPNYISQTLPDDYFFIGSSYTLPDVTLEYDWEGISGAVSGIWTAENNPHRIVGDIFVGHLDILEIQAGTEILFMGDYDLQVHGTLLAVGAVVDSVRFTSGRIDPGPGDWDGIKMWADDAYGQPISQMKYCVIEYGGSGYTSLYLPPMHGMVIENSAVRLSGSKGASDGNVGVSIRNCTFADNIGDGIYLLEGDEISGCSVFGNGGNGISVALLNGGGETLISKNRVFLNQLSGVFVQGSFIRVRENEIFNNLDWGINGDYGSFEVIGNLIEGNEDGIIFQSSYSISATIMKNTVVGNSGDGITTSGDLIIHSNIFSLNGGTGFYAITGNAPTATYNAIWGNGTDFSGNALPEYFGVLNSTNANGDPCDIYVNILMDPEFFDQALGDFNLLESSPCIDAGNPDPEFNDPDGTIADMGAFPVDQNGTPTESQSFGSFKSIFR